ncbi:MAG TPA: hypothetical protein P5218_02915 [Planctomycetota bacterium]|nr:hypothetical protein [Planctomycetota bacterium]HRV80355.1 hypothetical protein [Planctomycetota bacterium]
MSHSPPLRQIILVHGRSTKPSEADKRRLVRTAMGHGVRRVSERAADELVSGQVAFTLAYYGDISNRILADKARHWLTERDAEHDWGPCEGGGYYYAALARSLARPTEAFGPLDYDRMLAEEKDLRYVDEIAAIASRIANPLGLGQILVRHSSIDLGAYFLDPAVGEAVRARVELPLLRALRAGRKVCLIGHSMGCVVAYDALWRLSRRPEFLELLGDSPNPVDLWLTLGNPLGEPGMRANLLDASQAPDDRFPRNILRNWINISAEDDYIAHDKTVADDYREMLDRGYVHRLVDRPPIYNFWNQAGHSNPHKLYGYLDNPAVGAEIARWILGHHPELEPNSDIGGTRGNAHGAASESRGNARGAASE